MKALLQAVVIVLACSTAVAQEQTWTPNFHEADIREVIQEVANALGAKSVIIDPLVKGKVDVYSQVPLNREEYYDLFLNMLDTYGFIAINNDGVLRIVPNKKARMIPTTGSAEEALGSGFDTDIIHLKHISAAKAVAALRPMVPQYAQIAQYGNDAIILSDTPDNIKRMRRVLEQLDISSRIQTELVKLRFASAVEIVEILDRLNKGGDPQQQKQLTMVPDSRTNTILVRGEERLREETKKLIQELDRPGPQTGNIRTIYLQHASAESLEGVLNGVISNIEQGQQGQGAAGGPRQLRSAVVADLDTNSLIITAQGETLESLLQVVERLDVRRVNVLIEAVIAEVSDTANRELGVEWFFTDEDSGVFGSSVNAANRTRLAPLAEAVGNNDSDTDTQTAIAGALSQIPGQTLGIGRLNSTVDFAVVLNALHDNTDSNILALPKVITMDNSLARFESGQEVPFVTGTSTNTGGNVGNVFNQITREQIGDILEVTPHVNQGGSMELEISLEVSSLSNASASDIITNKNTISTSIRADDGEMIVLGGLIRDNYQDVQRKVPLLGDVPLLGRLFRNNFTELRKNNLMVFIRAKILHDEHDTYDFTAEKYDFIQKRQQEMRDSSDSWLPKDKVPVLPDWSAPRPQPKAEQPQSEQEKEQEQEQEREQEQPREQQPE